jgi:hypothetical protein
MLKDATTSYIRIRVGYSSRYNFAEAKSLELTTPQQLKGNREDACQFEWLSSKMRLYREQTRLTRSENAPTTERQSQRRLSVRVALIEDEAVPRTDKVQMESLKLLL